MDDDELERLPIESVLGPMKIHPLEPGWTALEAFVLMKCSDEDGDTAWAYRTTQTPNREELLGALMVQMEVLRRELVDEWDAD